MGGWNLHWLAATGDLSPWRDRIAAEIDAARQAMAPFIDPGQFDILIERAEDAVRPDIGIALRVQRPNLLSFGLDPYNDGFGDTLQSGLIRRQMVNCAHRALRAAGPGYGFTLSGALVSEGLAAQFVRLVLDTPAEPWDRASDDLLARHWPDQRTMMSTKYDASRWFYGNGDLPFGLGFAMGNRIVEHWLLSGVELDPERLVTVPAPKVLAAMRSRAMAG